MCIYVLLSLAAFAVVCRSLDGSWLVWVHGSIWVALHVFITLFFIPLFDTSYG